MTSDGTGETPVSQANVLPVYTYVISTEAGEVSSVTNSDGSLTFSPTSGAVVGKLAVGNANTWTAQQTFSPSDFALLGSSSGFTLLNSGLSGTASSTLTLPTTASDTLAALGTTQTWTGVQTFGTSVVTSGTVVALNVTGTATLPVTTITSGTVTALNVTGTATLPVTVMSSGTVSTTLKVTGTATLPVTTMTTSTVSTSLALTGASPSIITYNNVTTAGAGLPYIVGEAVTAAVSASQGTVVQYIAPAAAARYRISGVIDTTSGTNSGTITMNIAYTNSQGISISQGIAFQNAAAIATVTGASKSFYAVPSEIAVNAVAQTIVVSSVVSGTNTYAVAAVIERIA